MRANDSILMMLRNKTHTYLTPRALLRLLGSSSVVLLFIFTVRYISNPYGYETSHSSASTAEESGFQSSQPSSIEWLNTGIIPLEHKIDPHRRSNDRHGIGAESTIGKVTVLFHGRDPTFVRAIQTHASHNWRFGYPLLVLRHGLLDGVWTKPATILSALLEELRKPEGERLKWLM